TLVISSGHVLSQMLDQQTAEVVHGLLKAHKVRIITQADVERVEGVGGVSKVVLNNGKELPCQMVVFCKGVVPNMELARDALINVRKGIIVDEGMRTSAPNIFAAGDVAEAIDPVTGQGTVRSFWAKAMRQGHVAGENMAGGDARYQGDLVSNSLIVYGTTVLTMGHTRPDERDRSIVISAEGEGWFRRIVLREGRVIGAVLIGDITSAEALGCLLTSRSDASELTIKMLDRSFDKVMLAELGPLECPADNQNS
ncbi:MAG TPA: FAD-dependent oxidoreductase, partial [Methanomassiliicoccales archaeon]|nr:FAD-dependent oxidoreductase [Methanomassiliicoccales archaeon]